MKTPTRKNGSPPGSSLQTELVKAFGLHKLGRLPEAEKIYRTILKSHRHHFDAAHLLGLILLDRDDAEAAEEQINRALKFANSAVGKEGLAEAHYNLGTALMRLGRLEEAAVCFDRTLAIKPYLAKALLGRGETLYELGRLDDTIVTYDKLIALQPKSAVAHFKRAKALHLLRRFDDAVAGFTRAIALKPDYHEAFCGRAMSRLLLENFADGWEDLEHRLSFGPQKGLPTFVPSSVTREYLKGKRVVVVAEQGVGDEIMAASMIPELARDARDVRLQCDPRLSGLFRRSFPAVELTAREMPSVSNTTGFDCIIPGLSLGRFYRNTREAFPDRQSYLLPSLDIAAKWKERISQLGSGLKVGISWRGGVPSTRNASRSVPLDAWTAILGIEHLCFVSLQYGQAREEIDRVNLSLPHPIVRFEPTEIDDFDQLAGLVSSLDLIVSVQNTVVHLSGALGKACKVLVPYVPEWRYGALGDRMLWYPSVQLYRQSAPDIWREPLGRIAADIRHTSA